jgi:hypothetical protein
MSHAPAALALQLVGLNQPALLRPTPKEHVHTFRKVNICGSQAAMASQLGNPPPLMPAQACCACAAMLCAALALSSMIQCCRRVVRCCGAVSCTRTGLQHSVRPSSHPGCFTRHLHGWLHMLLALSRHGWPPLQEHAPLPQTTTTTALLDSLLAPTEVRTAPTRAQVPTR